MAKKKALGLAIATILLPPLLLTRASNGRPESAALPAHAKAQPFPTVQAPVSTFPVPIQEPVSEGGTFTDVDQKPSLLAGIADNAHDLGATVGAGIVVLASLIGLGAALAKGADKAPKEMKSPGPGSESLFAGSGVNPLIGILIVIGILLTLAIVVVEAGFIFAEGALALPSLAGNPFAIVGELILIGLSLFLINLEVAYWVYVYRVAKADLDEKVQLILTPFDWGLSE